MNVTRSMIGGLDCHVVDALPAGGMPSLLVIFCHGYGAPGTDLVPLGQELLEMRPELSDKVRFVFPAAPIDLSDYGMYGGRAWWPLNVAAFVEAIERGEFGALRGETPPGMLDARKKLEALVDELKSSTGLPMSKIVLGGFSQGSMVTTDLALSLPEPPAALCIYSGTLLREGVWKQAAAARGPMPILQSHGRQDQILPFQAAEWLRDLFVAAGLSVDFIPFHGPHTIPYEALEKFAALLVSLTE